MAGEGHETAACKVGARTKARESERTSSEEQPGARLPIETVMPVQRTAGHKQPSCWSPHCCKAEPVAGHDWHPLGRAR